MTWQLMVRVYVAPTPKQPFASVALTVIGNEPVCVGVPERTPAADSPSPAGSEPLLIVNVTGGMALPAVENLPDAAVTPAGVVLPVVAPVNRQSVAKRVGLAGPVPPV